MVSFVVDFSELFHFNFSDEEEDKEDALPVSAWKPPMTVPTEERGAGANKYVFFVCNRVSLFKSRITAKLYF